MVVKGERLVTLGVLFHIMNFTYLTTQIYVETNLKGQDYRLG